MSMVTAMPTLAGPSLAVAGQQATPSTDGFLQALDQFLSSNDPGTAAGGESTLTSLFGMDTFSVSSAFSQTSAASISTDSDISAAGETDLSENPTLCLQIASILQALGFQVRPEDIAQLSPLDAQQLDSAMEFVQRNLQRGLDTSEIAECTSLLLPRPWKLDDLDGAPISAGQASGASESAKLPEGFLQAVESARKELAQTTSAPQTPAEPKAESAAIPTNPGPGAQTQKKSPGGSPGESDQKGSQQEAFAAWTRPQDSFQTALAADAADPSRPRHLTPGGTASELIGRQVLEKVHVQLAEGKRELSLRLWPEELGEVRLSLRMSDGNGIQANMVVENDAVRQAMLDSMPQLRDALARHGLDLEKMTVSVGTGGSAMAGSGSEADRKRGDESRDGRRGGGFQQTEIAVPTRLELGRDTGYRNGKNSLEIWS
ncbi:MAG: flagellar hook-length control protein FliK [Fibrobacterota bacterium]|nr:flagellar hook-length control protein FliK [Fibrobacterota bacterium]QQS03563.1 MAG: flagellar hook-length control protein FliK [Fibrobacterota bacterium]